MNTFDIILTEYLKDNFNLTQILSEDKLPELNEGETFVELASDKLYLSQTTYEINQGTYHIDYTLSFFYRYVNDIIIPTKSNQYARNICCHDYIVVNILNPSIFSAISLKISLLCSKIARILRNKIYVEELNELLPKGVLHNKVWYYVTMVYPIIRDYDLSSSSDKEELFNDLKYLNDTIKPIDLDKVYEILFSNRQLVNIYDLLCSNNKTTKNAKYSLCR